MQAIQAISQHSSAPANAGAILRRQCACGTHTPGGAACGKCGGEARASVPPIVNQVLAQPGEGLDDGTRDFMERGFGADFSGVRVHTDARAAQSARAVHAKAYTVGRDIVFKDGLYQPQSPDGRMLLAHELAHVAQQRAGAKSDSASAREIGEPGSAAEHQADEAAHIVMRGGRVPRLASAASSLQRAGDGTPPAAAAPAADPAKTDTPADGAKAGAKPACGGLDLFTRIDMPWPIPDSYFHDGDPLKEKAWDTQKDAAAKDKCVANGTFPDLKLAWDFGNPKLGRYYGKDINKNDVSFDVLVAAIQDSKPCCQCLGGNVKWSFNLEVKHNGETGRTQSPLTGSKNSNACEGERCCSVTKSLPIGLSYDMGDLQATISGTVDLDAATYGDVPKQQDPGKTQDPQQKKGGLSTGAKVAIGVGAAVGAGLLIGGGIALGKALHH